MAGLCLEGHNGAMRIARLAEKLLRFGELSLADKWLFGRAVVELAFARVQLATTPFERLARRLSDETGSVNTQADPELLQRVGFAVAAAANNVPWRSDCFPQTLAAHFLLKRFGYESTIHFGVDRTGGAELDAHAWLSCGDTIVTGGGELQRYTELHRIES